MNDVFSFEIDRSSPVMVARPIGVLDAYTAPDLRGALLECLGEQPAAIIVDASSLVVADEIGLTVLGAAAQEAERWPGIRLVLAAGSAEVREAAERMGVDRYLPVCRDVATATQTLGALPTDPVVHYLISPDRNGPGVARLAVQEFCQTHGIGGDGDAAQLVASELVTNAVVHAGTVIQLTLRLVPGQLHISVRDSGPGQVRIVGIVDESSPSGRGLLLVDALATRWGIVVPTVGKIVWAVVRVRPAASPGVPASDQAQ